MKDLGYVLWCYGDPYIVDFKETVEHSKVSIILPVYNKGWCVEAALRSLQRQTLKEIEIICVDDGSIDDSIEKIKNYQQHDTRIKLVENGENRGTLYTRAHGIRESTGDYIMFLDPDDLYATNDIVEVAYNKCIELNVDVVCFGACVLCGQSLYTNTFCHGIEIDRVYFDKDMFVTNVYRYCWNKCIKRECLLKSLDIVSDDIINKHLSFWEDQIFMHALSKCITTYICIQLSGYWYNFNSQSVCLKHIVDFPFDYCIKRSINLLCVYNKLVSLSPHLQDFLLRRFRSSIKDHSILGPYTDEQLQQLYDIYMQINFDDEHKTKLSEYLQNGMEEMRKLRDGSQKE